MTISQGIQHASWVLVMALIAGCGPEVPDEELGRVLFELPEIPPGYEPYTLPDLSTSTDDTLDEAPADQPAGRQSDATRPAAASAAPQ